MPVSDNYQSSFAAGARNQAKQGVHAVSNLPGYQEPFLPETDPAAIGVAWPADAESGQQHRLATVEAQSLDLSPVEWHGVAVDAQHDPVIDRLAVTPISAANAAHPVTVIVVYLRGRDTDRPTAMADNDTAYIPGAPMMGGVRAQPYTMLPVPVSEVMTDVPVRNGADETKFLGSVTRVRRSMQGGTTACGFKNLLLPALFLECDRVPTPALFVENRLLPAPFGHGDLALSAAFLVGRPGRRPFRFVHAFPVFLGHAVDHRCAGANE